MCCQVRDHHFVQKGSVDCVESRHEMNLVVGVWDLVGRSAKELCAQAC